MFKVGDSVYLIPDHQDIQDFVQYIGSNYDKSAGPLESLVFTVTELEPESGMSDPDLLIRISLGYLDLGYWWNQRFKTTPPVIDYDEDDADCI